jgi:hypothetical protein
MVIFILGSRTINVAPKAPQLGMEIAMDMQTRHLVACHIGDRSHASAQQFGGHLPAVSCAPVSCSTDHYAVDIWIIPTVSYQAITQHVRPTRPIARGTHPRWQCVSRLVRDTRACALLSWRALLVPSNTSDTMTT